jgi:hypothetical protein
MSATRRGGSTGRAEAVEDHVDAEQVRVVGARIGVTEERQRLRVARHHAEPVGDEVEERGRHGPRAHTAFGLQRLARPEPDLVDRTDVSLEEEVVAGAGPGRLLVQDPDQRRPGAGHGDEAQDGEAELVERVVAPPSTMASASSSTTRRTEHQRRRCRVVWVRNDVGQVEAEPGR